MPFSVGVVSLGCNKNRVDTETALGLLQEEGFTFTPRPEEADILMVNTCGFIDSAKEESINTILEMAQYKETGRCRLLVVPGCLAQRSEKDRQPVSAASRPDPPRAGRKARKRLPG